MRAIDRSPCRSCQILFRMMHLLAAYALMKSRFHALNQHNSGAPREGALPELPGSEDDGHGARLE